MEEKKEIAEEREQTKKDAKSKPKRKLITRTYDDDGSDEEVEDLPIKTLTKKARTSRTKPVSSPRKLVIQQVKETETRTKHKNDLKLKSTDTLPVDVLVKSTVKNLLQRTKLGSKLPSKY